jgi:hypothetical protein
MARHPLHRCHHPFIERRLAELLACKVGMDCNHLDHVPAQHCEVLFVHWLHDRQAFFNQACCLIRLYPVRHSNARHRFQLRVAHGDRR